MIYLDSSALLKLLFQEAESDALEVWLGRHEDAPKVASELAKVEVLRACRRLDIRSVPLAQVLLAHVDLIPLTGAVVDQACFVAGDDLRSLDALHLASAMALGRELAVVVTYDARLAAAAKAVALRTASPGA